MSVEKMRRAAARRRQPAHVRAVIRAAGWTAGEFARSAQVIAKVGVPLSHYTREKERSARGEEPPVR